MDIRGLSYARIKQLLDSELLRDVADLYKLTADQFLALDGYQKKSATSLIAAINASRAQPLSRLLTALGIPHVGETAARLLARHFGTMDALASASVAQIEEIRGLGGVIAQSVASYFHDPTAQKLVAKLTESGVTMKEPVGAAASGALNGQTVVITGTLPSLSRSQAAALIEANGGRTTSSVSKATTFVLAGTDPGSKFDRATSLGIPIIDESELLHRIGQ